MNYFWCFKPPCLCCFAGVTGQVTQKQSDAGCPGHHLQKMAASGSRERSGRLEASPRDPYKFSENGCKEGLGTVPWRPHSLLSAHQALLFQNINTIKGKNPQFLFLCRRYITVYPKPHIAQQQSQTILIGQWK